MTQYGLIAALLVATCLGCYSTILSSRLDTANEALEEQQKTIEQQSGIIATQAFQFQVANAISAATNQYGINTDAAAQEKEIEYRTIIKKEPTCDLAVPADITRRLLDYTYRLRSRAMPASTGNNDATGSASIATGTLTYCQAVLWIDQLLAAIDKANNQLLAIRQLETERGKQ